MKVLLACKKNNWRILVIGMFKITLFFNAREPFHFEFAQIHRIEPFVRRRLLVSIVKLVDCKGGHTTKAIVIMYAKWIDSSKSV